MSTQTSIEWTDVTWNPVRGCSRVSAGCRNCYAERQAARFSGPGDYAHGFVERTKSGTRWTGRVELVPEKLREPLSWRKPRRVFVNSMSDLFHEALPDEVIDRVFAVMALAPQHTFQVLTKRPERMRDFLHGDLHGGYQRRAAIRDQMGKIDLPRGRLFRANPHPWPLPNVHLGVSVEDQDSADRRISVLLDTPAAVRWISAEPLLGPVDLAGVRGGNDWLGDPRDGTHDEAGLDWVVCGGESGPGARPCDVRWLRAIVEQCRAARVPVFVKQLGAHVVDRNDAGFDGVQPHEWPSSVEADLGQDTVYQGADCRVRLRDRKGGDMSEWPEDLRVREFPVPRSPTP